MNLDNLNALVVLSKTTSNTSEAKFKLEYNTSGKRNVARKKIQNLFNNFNSDLKDAGLLKGDFTPAKKEQFKKMDCYKNLIKGLEPLLKEYYIPNTKLAEMYEPTKTNRSFASYDFVNQILK